MSRSPSPSTDPAGPSAPAGSRAAPQHLQPPAHAHHTAAGPHVRQDVVIPALRAQERQIADRRLGAEQHHHVRIPRNRPAGRHEREVHVRLQAQRIGIVIVRQA